MAALTLQEMMAEYLQSFSGGVPVNPNQAQPMPQPMPGPPGGGMMKLPEPPGPQLNPELTAQIQDIENEKIRGMGSIMGSKATTAGTALAQTLAAGVAGHYGRKEQAGRIKVLTKAAEKKQREADDALERLTRRQGESDLRSETYLDIAEINQRDQTREIPEGDEIVVYGRDPETTLFTIELGRKPAPGAEAREKSQRGGLTQYQFDRQRRNLGKDMVPHTAMMNSLNEIGAVLAPYAVGGAEQDAGDIPGVGYVEGGANPFGMMVRAVQDAGGRTGGEGARIFAATSQALNQIIRNRAGLTQSKSEMERVLTELETTGFSGEVGLITALRRLERAQIADLRNVENSYNAAVVDSYTEGFETNPFDFAPSGQKFKSIGETQGTTDEEDELLNKYL